MHPTPLILLIACAATVGVIHSVLPDHWVPLAVVGRTERWSLLRVGRVSALATGGHVLTSVVLGGVIALVGLEFQKQIETQQGHIVGPGQTPDEKANTCEDQHAVMWPQHESTDAVLLVIVASFGCCTGLICDLGNELSRLELARRAHKCHPPQNVAHRGGRVVALR
jgi:hypothetical protein